MCARVCVCVCVCGCVCVWVCWFVCTSRASQNITERSPIADTVPVESQQPALQDDQNYTTVYDVQQQMLAMSSNPAYKFVPEHSQQPLQGDDRVYSNINVSKQEKVVRSGKQRYGTALEAAASDT